MDAEFSSEKGFLRLLAEEKSEFRNKDGWKLYKKTQDYEVWKKRDPILRADLIKSKHTLRGIPPEAVKDIVLDVECWNRWDGRLPSASVLDNKKQGKIIYWRMKLPYCVKNRDAIHGVSTRDVTETKTTYVYYHHIPKHSMKPEKKNIIRMETHFLGMIIAPHPSYPNSTSLTIVMQVDTKGWLLPSMANRYVAKTPILWQSLLSDYYWDVYSKSTFEKKPDKAHEERGEAKEGKVQEEDLEEYESFASDSLVVEARKMTTQFPPSNKKTVENLCAEISDLAQKLERCQDEEGDETAVTQCAEIIAKKLEDLEMEMQTAIASIVVDNFRAPPVALNTLVQATLSLPESPEREEHYSVACEGFIASVTKMTNTAKLVSTCSVLETSGAIDSKLKKEIRHNAKLTKHLARRTIDASKHVFSGHLDLDAMEAFQAYKDNYVEQAEKLMTMVDASVPRLLFFKKAETVVKKSLESAIDQSKSGTDFYEAFSLIYGTNTLVERVVAVVKVEVASCKVEQQKAILEDHISLLRKANSQMLMTAQEVINKNDDSSARKDLKTRAKKLRVAMRNLVEAMEVYEAAFSSKDKDENQVQTSELAVTTIEPAVEGTVEETGESAHLDDQSDEVLELEVTCFTSDPEKGEPSEAIEHAAMTLKENANQWDSSENVLVKTVSEMAAFMMALAKYARDKRASLTKEWIDVTLQIVEKSHEVLNIARKIVDACTDAQMKTELQQVMSKICTISTQLKILSSVKAGETLVKQFVQAAIEMLRDNSRNLMSAVSELLFVAESATIRVPPEERSRIGLEWIKN